METSRRAESFIKELLLVNCLSEKKQQIEMGNDVCLGKLKNGNGINDDAYALSTVTMGGVDWLLNKFC